MKVYQGRIVTENAVLENGCVGVEDGKIVYVGENCPPNGTVFRYPGCYIAPGFIDIHCHAGGPLMAFDDPAAVAACHRAHGTTSMLLTFYRDVPHDKLLWCLDRVKELIGRSNVVGAHLEGPVLNANFGTGSGQKQPTPDEIPYDVYIKSGVVRQWTTSPEVPGVTAMIADIAAAGIVPAVGHSKASYAQVKAAHAAGARIVTHIFDATGTTHDPATMGGTEDVSFDEACMLMDDMFYEVICDSAWVHVKREKLALLIKTVGLDRVVAITDSFRTDGNEARDINIITEDNGREGLAGSKLTMDRVAANLYDAGYDAVAVAKLTASNAARAIGLADRGVIAEGKKADLVVLDERMRLVDVL